MAYNRGEPVKQSTISYIFLVILAITFGAIIVLLLIENSNVKSKLIEPTNCPQISGNYGVIPNVDKSTLGDIYGCSSNDTSGKGALGTDPCTFSSTVKSLIDAENICNNFPGVCKGFYYTAPTTSGGNGSMTFYNTSFTPKSLSGSSSGITVVDVYTKQI
jgi:hypothetical protein